MPSIGIKKRVGMEAPCLLYAENTASLRTERKSYKVKRENYYGMQPMFYYNRLTKLV